MVGVIFSGAVRMWSRPACPEPDLLDQVWLARLGCCVWMTETKLSGLIKYRVSMLVRGGFWNLPMRCRILATTVC